MKKKILLSCLTLIVLNFSSCKKMCKEDKDDNTEETINVNINSNETYKYNLPATANASDFTVSSPSAKSSLAIVDNTSGSNTFVYTPAQSFDGADVVVVTNQNASGHQGGCEHHGKGHHDGHGSNSKEGHHHHCDKKGGENHTHKITFNITVKSIAN